MKKIINALNILILIISYCGDCQENVCVKEKNLHRGHKMLSLFILKRSMLTESSPIDQRINVIFKKLYITCIQKLLFIK